MMFCDFFQVIFSPIGLRFKESSSWIVKQALNYDLNKFGFFGTTSNSFLAQDLW